MVRPPLWRPYFFYKSTVVATFEMNKSIPFMRHVILVFLIVNCIIKTKAQSTREFPENTYWVNTEFNLSPSTFKDKLVVVLFADMNSPEGLYHMIRLQELAFKNPHLQFIQIVKGNSEYKVTLSELTDFIQEFNIAFPFGVAPALEPFVDDTKRIEPTVYVYDRSPVPTETLRSTEQINAFYNRIRKTEGVRNGVSGYGVWQMRSEILPSNYASPLIELPGALAADESSSTMFIAENAQHRISRYSGSGELKDFAGGIERGDKDSNLGGAKFSYVSGLTYDPINDLLFVADLGNQKVKAIDYNSKLCFTFLGNGSLGSQLIEGFSSPTEVALNFPVDVIVREKFLYVLMASPAQIIKVESKTGKFIEQVSLVERLEKSESPIKISKGDKGFLVLTNEGSIYELNYENWTNAPVLRYQPETWFDLPGDVAEKKGSLFLTMPRRNVLVKVSKGKEKILAGVNNSQGYFNSKKGLESKFFQPREIVLTGNKLLLSDRRNHMIRFVALDKGGTGTIKPQYSFEYFSLGDAINSGEGVYFESEEIFGEGVNEVFFTWDISEYEFVKEGYNFVGTEGIQGVSLAEDGLSEKGIKINVSTEKSEPFVQFELYLTLRSKANPDLVFIKKAHVNFTYVVIPGEELKHEIEFRPHLLP
jgi:hypothetical protein